MGRLAELTKSQRSRLGWGMLVAGAFLLVIGIWWIHYSSVAEITLVNGVEVPVVVDYFNWVPRGWIWKALGYLAVFAASQAMLGGAAIAFLIREKMTWARATFTAWLVWIELVLIFGMVPSEWLNLSQTDLNWSPQRVAITVPSWLVLGNDVAISLAALKDVISGGYHVTMLAVAGLFAYRIQGINTPRTASDRPGPISPYGRPLVKGGE